METSWPWRRVGGYVGTNVSNELDASFFRVVQEGTQPKRVHFS